MRGFALVLFLFVFVNFSFPDVITRISSNTYINWTKGVVVCEYFDNVEFLVGRNFDKKFLDLKREVKRKIISELFFSLGKVYFDENRIVDDVLNLFPEKRKGIASLFDRVDIRDFRYFGGKVFSTYVIDLYGENGIFNILRLPSIPRDYKEFLGFAEPKDYTGFIISTKGFKFNVSLSTKILSKSGKLLYSYGDYKENYRYIHFFSSLSDAISSGIFGDVILYAFPFKVSGENYTDIVVNDEVAEKLLSKTENYDILFKGAVGIIIED